MALREAVQLVGEQIHLIDLGRLGAEDEAVVYCGYGLCGSLEMGVVAGLATSSVHILASL